MRYFLQTSAGRRFQVAIEDGDGDRYRVRCGDQALMAEFADVDRLGQYLLKLGPRTYAVSIEEESATDLAVTIAGDSFRVRALDERERAARTVAGGARSREELVTAIMPGIVVEVRVAPGDSVAAGGPVVVLEAMKMQNEIPSRNGGLVREVLVQAGQTVAASQPLVRLEPLPEEGSAPAPA